MKDKKKEIKIPIRKLTQNLFYERKIEEEAQREESIVSVNQYSCVVALT